MILFKFKTNTDLSQWQIIDDVIMGGRSNGSFRLNENGYGEFYGKVSLENNGGFSSVRYSFKTVNISKYNAFVIKVKGDGKKYQFRVKDSRNSRHSYICTFQTDHQWQEIVIPFNTLTASFRGYKLDIPNYKGDKMEEMSFLIGNKKAEKFNLLIEEIYVK